MKIGIVGLGLIGGSLAKAIKLQASHRVYGCDLSEAVQLRARMVEAIDGRLTAHQLRQCDLVLVALYPDEAVSYLQSHAASFKPGAVVCDCCGIKTRICRIGFALAREHGFTFVGGHPMAGIERFGFAAARAGLFNRATMILVPEPETGLEVLEGLKAFFLSIGFGRIKITTAEEHDRVIAYTSQLAHVLSSAYIKSPAARDHAGISAGSFRDMTRVATLQPRMWSQLCLENRAALLPELSGLIERLGAYRDALADNDFAALAELFEEGCRCKDEVDKLTPNGARQGG